MLTPIAVRRSACTLARHRRRHMKTLSRGRYAGPMPRLMALVLVVLAASAHAAEPPPAGLGHDHPLTGRIWDVAGARFIITEALVARLAPARFVLLGERHDNADHHAF